MAFVKYLGALGVILICAVLTMGLSFTDPLNAPGTADAGAVHLGKDIAYGPQKRHRLDVYAPQNPGGNAPVVMFIHGGSWAGGNRHEYAFVGYALAARGFVTVLVDYRLVPDVQYPAFIEDNAAAIKWIEQNIGAFGGDAEKLFLAGHSAGAYNAVMLGLDKAFLADQAVGVPIRGIAGLAGPYDFYPFEFGEVERAFGAAPNPAGTQPVNLASPEAVPMMLATGTGDLIVKPINTETLSAKLRDAGAQVLEREYDGIGHVDIVAALGTVWRWRAPVLEDMVAFFASLGAFAEEGTDRTAEIDWPDDPAESIALHYVGAGLNP